MRVSSGRAIRGAAFVHGCIQRERQNVTCDSPGHSVSILSPPASLSVKTGRVEPSVNRKKRGFCDLSGRVTDWLTVYPEVPDDKYPFWATTGRIVYHFHTRTKTGQSRELYDARPDAFVQINEEDARRLGIHEGDMVEVASRRATITAPAQIGDILPGHVFIPFHYGYWDEPGSEHGGPDGRARAANELTFTGWDPVK